MATPPARATLFPVGSLLPANAKTYFGQLYDYIYALLGADGSAAAARNALEVPVFRIVRSVCQNAPAPWTRALDVRSHVPAMVPPPPPPPPDVSVKVWST